MMTFESGCYGLFYDIADNLYCSLYEEHQVVKQSVRANGSTPVIVAGSADARSRSNALYEPRGIFVDINFDLYVADSHNQRVQLFHLGEKNGITVAGNSKTSRIVLSRPTGVIMDANKDLYIVDSVYNRIIRSNSIGFECVVGCSSADSSTSYQLWTPTVAAFDNFGNIFVANRAIQGVQKFLLMTDTCSK
jgi:hypothetical protein